MKYALVLNDMRSSNIEDVQVVRVADTYSELVEWYTEQLAPEMWHDGSWNKAFAKGSELEWYNPHPGPDDYWGGIWTGPDDTQVGHSLVKA